MKQFRDSKVEKNQRRGAEPAGGDGAAAGGADYARLGEQVTAVLTTAEEAAAEIRGSAHRDAAKILVDAEESAKAARAEAEALRVDADAYRDQTRTTADKYAEQTRRAVDEEAAKARSALEEEARTVRTDAERTAREIEAEALRRRDALAESTADLEQRIAGMATTFRGMTVELEHLLPTTHQGAEDQPAAAEGDALDDDSMEDALKPEPAASASH